jgi:hypothetical protein
MSAARVALITLGLVLFVADTARAADTIRPASSNAKYFGLLIGPEPGRLVVGFLDESKGTGRGFDLAVLDLDGDGRPETRHGLAIHKYDDDWINYKFEFVVDEVEYTLDLDDLAPGRLQIVSVRWTISWAERTVIPINGMTIQWGHWTVLFVNGGVVLADSPLAAAFMPRIRLGPPFRYEFSMGLRGPDPVLNVALLDVQGLTMRFAYDESKEVPIALTLRRGKEVVLEATSDYG